ncbi:MAG: tRNA (adenosine(37)-N6)-threonylcarbamoyltransferase complex dimerization subunit type 1 TsaB [Rickettsiaceae bacterium]|nr:tRNA (adenosine(37)-N6)-threonylcarbamoyltransferase complex dimerization subunit type 1 TsaB [Rickettsiaceae bacterium]
MFILGFDTSNSYSMVSISKNIDILYSKKDSNPNSQAENLLPMIEEALKSCSLWYDKLDYVAAINGPGSFTGIRIALAAARGLSLASSNIKTVCVNNFQTINFRARQQCKEFDLCAAFVNAYRDQLYMQLFTKKGEYGEPKLLLISEAKKYLESLKGNIVISGSGIEQIYNTTSLPPKNIIVLPRFSYPDARFICRVAHQQIVMDNVNENLEPLYIRAPDAKLPS